MIDESDWIIRIPSFDGPAIVSCICHSNGIYSKCSQTAFHNICTQDLQKEVAFQKSITNSQCYGMLTDMVSICYSKLKPTSHLNLRKESSMAKISLDFEDDLKSSVDIDEEAADPL